MGGCAAGAETIPGPLLPPHTTNLYLTSGRERKGPTQTTPGSSAPGRSNKRPDKVQRMSTTATRKNLDFIHDDVEFYPHQIEGVRSLARMNNFLLADEMGLGKSLQALAVSAIDFQMGYATRILVVAPSSLKGNWEEEIREHTNFKPLVLGRLTPAKRSEVIAEFADNDDSHVLIVNYEQVIPHLQELNEVGFDIVIYDEAHYLKNPKAKRTKASQGLVAKRHFLLTGSPMLGHVSDLWSLLYRIDPNMEKYWHFLNRYAVFGGYKDKQIVGVKNRDELYERLQGVMVRRLKSDVLDLPEKQRIVIRLDLSPLQRRLYDELSDELRLEAPSGDASPMEIENALTKFLRLKQICGTPSTLGFVDGEETVQYPDESAKLDRAEEMVDEIVNELGEHVVVFTQFRGVQKALASRLEKRGIPVAQLHGDIPTEERVPVVTKWKNGTPGVIVCMLQVAGVGLNMTAANKMIFLDKLFVPKLNEQAEDRIHRIGASETKAVQIFELQMRRTIEQRVETILKTKRQLFDDVVETDSFKKKLYAALMAEDDE
jgi:SNF2 family DNA or RNA helicase